MDEFSDAAGLVVGPVSLVIIGVLVLQIAVAYRTSTWSTDLRRVVDAELAHRGWWDGALIQSDSRVARVARCRGPSSQDDVTQTADGLLRRAGVPPPRLAHRRSEVCSAALCRLAQRSERIGHVDVLLRAWPWLRAAAHVEVGLVALTELAGPTSAMLARRFTGHLGRLSAAAAVVAVLRWWPWVQRSLGPSAPRWQELVGALVNLAVAAAMLWTLVAELKDMHAPLPKRRRARVAAAWLSTLALPVAVVTGTAENGLRAAHREIDDFAERLGERAHVVIGVVVMTSALAWGIWWHARRAADRSENALTRVESAALATAACGLGIFAAAAALRWPTGVLLGAFALLAFSLTVAGSSWLLIRAIGLRDGARPP